MILAAQLVTTLLCLYVGGEALVRGSSRLAMRLGISALSIGLTVVAFGTSTPELVVSLDAAIGGAEDIAVGNVVGSNIANVALILGLSALIRPLRIETKAVRFDTPLLLVVSIGLALMLVNGRLTRLEGVALVIGLCAFTWFTLRVLGRGSGGPAPGNRSEEKPRIAANLGLILGGLGLLVVGGHFFVAAAVELSRAVGISEAAIGLTVVAVGTSLPELSSSVVAAWRGEGDLAVGNVIGSNMFNILGILGVTALVTPLSPGGIGWLDLGVMVGVCIGVLPLLATKRVLGRVEGALLIGSFVVYTSYVLMQS